MITLKLSPPSGPAFHYDPPTTTSYGDQPSLTDPLEKKYVHLEASTVNVAGLGLFASRDIRKGDTIAVYGGYIAQPTNSTDPDDFRPYK